MYRHPVPIQPFVRFNFISYTSIMSVFSLLGIKYSIKTQWKKIPFSNNTFSMQCAFKQLLHWSSKTFITISWYFCWWNVRSLIRSKVKCQRTYRCYETRVLENLLKCNNLRSTSHRRIEGKKIIDVHWILYFNNGLLATKQTLTGNAL